MNIIKKISSFASNSWKEFSDLNDLQTESSTATSNETKLPVGDSSFEVIRRSEQEICQKKVSNGFFRKRFSKKKLLIDPRSPTIEFQRTPIFYNNFKENDSVILSPFNLHDMLESINSAVNVTPNKPLSIEEPEILQPHVNEAFEHSNIESNGKSEAENFEFDWNNFQFNDNEKVFTDSMIVEVSTPQLKSNQSELIVLPCAKVSSEKLSIELNAEKKNDEGNNNCKDDHNVESKESKPSVENNPIVSSTPNKWIKVNRLPRTPLSSIKNSPVVVSSTNELLKDGMVSKQDKPRRKKLNGVGRQLPKAPSTPLTPLFRSKKSVSHFDKENF
ncbi:hypothetical protein RDWZM_005548 [Blomia tropicalis]|uniref:Uncharacterized protein n=1 Tax=Blomia tropicalis TaxID=40697 RepID=A0A9Q0M5F8_BLOTA|nr:hypothetical protein RDWZM_005548 [Blomia tropicalis]